MKIKNTILAVSLFMGAATACTDEWNEHYSAAQLGDGVTLWTTINNDESLSNFKQVLQAANYDASLNGSQIFTVFAPTNDELTAEMRDNLIQQYNAEKTAGVKEKENSVVKEFIQNHIALYNYSVSDAMKDTTIRMMNGKRVAFTKTQFDGRDYISKNTPNKNGVLFKINDVAEYVPSVYEALAKAEKAENVWQYLKLFHEDKFDSKNSVPGNIIDGKTHYLDSVTNKRNKFFSEMLKKAEVLNEDSTYWMVVPTSEDWENLVTDYSKYYQYDQKVAERDSFQYHFPRFAVLEGTAFSKSANPKLFNSGTASASDSLMSTNALSYFDRQSKFGSYNFKYYQYDDPFGTDGVLADCEAFSCSNGKLFIANKWNISPRQTFLRDIVMEAESASTIDSLNVKSDNNRAGDTNQGKVVKITSDNPYYNKISGNSYLEITPSGVTNFSKALFDVRNVLSNVPYDVYVVIAPAEAGDVDATDIQKLPVTFRCALQCHNEEGEAYYINIADGKLQYPVADKSGTINTNYTKSAVYGQNRQNDPTKVDSVFIGTVTFPTCSSEVAEPQVKLLFQSYVTSSAFEKTANRTLRLDCIVFRPHED